MECTKCPSIRRTKREQPLPRAGQAEHRLRKPRALQGCGAICSDFGSHREL